MITLKENLQEREQTIFKYNYNSSKLLNESYLYSYLENIQER